MIESRVLHKARKGNSARNDVISLRCCRYDGETFAHFDVFPEEAVFIANALLHAYQVWWISEQEKKRKK